MHRFFQCGARFPAICERPRCRLSADAVLPLNSFYEWQGFMEGAALSGITAAQSILTAAKTR